MQKRNIEEIKQSAISKLKDDDYNIIYEIYFKHTSIHKLSRKLGISKLAVRYRKQRALRNLKSIILIQQLQRKKVITFKIKRRKKLKQKLAKYLYFI
ncbi:MAG: hypothetical protein K6343_01900 [Caldisericaceae bacterium]